MATTQPDQNRPLEGLDETTLKALHARDEQLICNACGVQYAETDSARLMECKICEDPRQFVPPTGQQWTTLTKLRLTHENQILPHPTAPNVHTIQSHPRLAIGQRAFIIQTAAGNILWDCLTLLDAKTVQQINAMGGLAAIVISHPHFYSTHLLWAAVFGCPVYLASDEEKWLTVPDDVMVVHPTGLNNDMPSLPGTLQEAELQNSRFFIRGPPGSSQEILGPDGTSTGARAVKVGGHFDGSMVLLWDNRLFTADTIMPTPSGTGRWKKGMNSFSFMWSYPNMIPLPPKTLASMWSVLKDLDFNATYGGFPSLDIESADVKERVLESMAIQVGHEGHDAEYWVSQFVGGLEQRSRNPEGMEGVEVQKEDVYNNPQGLTQSANPGLMRDNISGGVEGVEGMDVEPRKVVTDVAKEQNMSGVTGGSQPAKMVGQDERVETGMERVVEYQDRPVPEAHGVVEGGDAKML